jgi:hypothetical protein
MEVTVSTARKLLGSVLCVWLALSVAASAGGQSQKAPKPGSFRQSFPTEGLVLKTVGESRYFILKPGYQLTFKDDNVKNPTTLVITVLNETKNVGGIEARIVEERESKGGDLVEVSRNYFAIDETTKDVYYLGEDVDMYKKGKVVSHDGSWHHGSNGAVFGLMMPGVPSVGAKFYQEQAKGVAMDRAEIVAVTETLKTPAGEFKNCVRIKETSPLEPLLRDYKTYAPGVGLIKDGDLLLVSRTSSGS